MTLTFRPLPVLTLFAVPALALLVLLGSWQWQRFDAKRTAPPPADLAAAARPLEAVLPLAPPDRTPVTARGVWGSGTVGIYALRDGRRGTRLFSPLVTPAGTVLVDRGWVAEGVPAPAPSGRASLTGLLRVGARPNAYTPDNDPAAGTWYWPDVPALARVLAVRVADPRLYLAPLSVDPLATGTAVPNPWADPRGADLLPAERHLGYALTWWGLAAALVGVWLALHLRTGRIGWHRRR